jgi:hypothetical protein
MNTGQTLLTIGALILLTLTIFNVNRSLTENEDVMNSARFGLEAVSLATSIIEEASQLPFDEVSWDSTVLSKTRNDLTLHSNLGPDVNETSYALFDDFDDFDGYVRNDTTLQNIYKTSCEVVYIHPLAPNFDFAARSLYKKLSVEITSPSSSDTLKMSYIHGYWYFN